LDESDIRTPDRACNGLPKHAFQDRLVSSMAPPARFPDPAQQRARQLERYSLPPRLPPSALITLESMRTFLDHAGSAPFEPHLHDFHQLLWFRRGAGQHLVDFVRVPYEPRTLIYVPRGAVHAFRRDARAEGAILHFADSMALGEGDALSRVLRVVTLGTKPNRSLSQPESDGLMAAFAALDQELRAAHDSLRPAALDAALRLVLVRVARKFEDPMADPSPNQQRYLDFLELIERNYQNGLSVDSYARKLGISTKTLSRAVHEVSSSPPKHIISDRIALEVKRLLVHTNLSVKEIAAQLGINDAAYLTRFFRKHCGTAPTAFRGLYR